jgi:glycosyltransferase involved in cell wall biosynthesis
MRNGARRGRLLFILPGPLWEIKGSLRRRMEALSQSYEGLIVTTMPMPGFHRLGSFTLQALRFRRRSKAWVNLKFLLYGCWLALRARLTGSGWDLVVTYDPLRSGLIGLLVARIAGARFCPEVNGVYDSYANYIDDPPGPILSLKKILYPRLVAFTLARADGIKTLFPRQLDGFRPRLRDPVTENFFDYVDLSPFRNLGEEKVILFVGFPFRLKGVDLLIEAFKKIFPRHPDWKLKILGWFPDDRELRKAMDGHPAIFHHPPVYSPDMPKHMGTCGVFVLPSRTEAMGRVLLEAMAAGKPRLGARIEGIPTVIEDGVDGLLFRPGDAEDLAEKLDRLLGDEDLRRALGEAGKARAAREFNGDAYFARLMDFYGRVLRRGGETAAARGPSPLGVLDAAS